MAAPSTGTTTEHYNAEYINTGSFGRVIADYFTGDATKISASYFFGTDVVSSSAQMAADISGSYISGFNFG